MEWGRRISREWGGFEGTARGFRVDGEGTRTLVVKGNGVVGDAGLCVRERRERERGRKGEREEGKEVV